MQLTQAQAAKALGINQQAFWNLENEVTRDKLYTSLACQALELRLESWAPPGDTSKNRVFTFTDLRNWRESMAWRQIDAAEALGLTQQKYSEMENGARKKVPVRVALACAFLQHLEKC